MTVGQRTRGQGTRKRDRGPGRKPGPSYQAARPGQGPAHQDEDQRTRGPGRPGKTFQKAKLGHKLLKQNLDPTGTLNPETLSLICLLHARVSCASTCGGFCTEMPLVSTILDGSAPCLGRGSFGEFRVQGFRLMGFRGSSFALGVEEFG